MNKEVVVRLQDELVRYTEGIRRTLYAINRIRTIPVSKFSIDEKDKLEYVLIDVMKSCNEVTSKSIELFEKLNNPKPPSKEVMQIPSEIDPSELRGRQRERRDPLREMSMSILRDSNQR